MILSTNFSRAGQDFNASGRSVARSRYDKAEVQANIEYGATEWLALLVSPSLMYFHQPQTSAKDYYGVGESELGGKVRLAALGPAIISAQASVRSSGGLAGVGNAALIGKGGARADGRLLFGYGFNLAGYDGFIDAQAGYRTPFGELGGEEHVDLTLGIRPVANILLMAQSFSTFTQRASKITPARQAHKLEISGVYDFSKSISLQLGGYSTLAGRNSPIEKGVVSAMWLRF